MDVIGGLTPNPGGVVDPDDLVGRDEEFERLLEAISIGGGANVSGERRMGKTSLLRKLDDTLSRGGVMAVRVSAETSDIAIFTGRLMTELRRHRVLSTRITRWEKEVGGQASLMVGEVGLKLTAKASRGADPVRELSFADLLGSVAESGRMVLIIDEITVLCQHLGPERAAEFLRSLRALRQGPTPVSLVLSGSIGLHHALPDLTVIADLWQVDVGPLTTDQAIELARRLLVGVGADTTDEVVAEIAGATSGIPFYAHALVDQFRLSGDPDLAYGLTSEVIDEFVGRCLRDDTWKTTHYVTRLSSYYGEHADAVGAILDLVSADTGPVGLDQLGSHLVLHDLKLARVELVALVENLVRDHYLVREQNRVRMSSALLARAWRVHRWLD